MDTPKYVFDKTVLINNYNQMKKKLRTCDVHFALKSNGNIEVLKVLNSVGASFECASINEYKRLLEIGVNNERIIFGLPIKTEKIISTVYEGGCRYIVFDDMRELIKLEKLAPLSKKILRVYVTDLVALNIGYGMYLHQIEEYIQNDNLIERVDGISFHISENTNIENVSKVLDRIEGILKQFASKGKKGIILNIGGSYRLYASDEYYDKLNDRLSEMIKLYQISLIAEPGMAIVNTAGSFMTRVIMTKDQGVFTDVYIDGGLPNGITRSPGSINVLNREKTDCRKIYRFIDITCLNKVLFTKRLSCDIYDDDILEFCEMGAYSIVHQNDFHLWDKTNVEIKE